MVANPLPIDHVVDGIHIAGWRAVLFADQLRATGVVNVLKLYAELPYFPPDFNTFENALEDGVFIPLPALRRGLDFIHTQVGAGRPVLIVCGAGMSRSATFVLAYLLEKGYDLREAFHLLRRAHPETELNPKMWQSLITHYQLTYTLDDTWDWIKEAD